MCKREYWPDSLLTMHDHLRPYLDDPRPFNNDPDYAQTETSLLHKRDLSLQHQVTRSAATTNTTLKGKKNLDVGSQKKLRGNVWKDCRSKFGENWTREEDLEEIKGREGVWSVRKGKKIWEIERSGKTGRGREKSETGDQARLMEGGRFEANWRAKCGGCELGKDKREKYLQNEITGRRTIFRTIRKVKKW